MKAVENFNVRHWKIHATHRQNCENHKKPMQTMAKSIRAMEKSVRPAFLKNQ